MRLGIYAALVGLLAIAGTASDRSPELSAWDLLAEYQRLEPLNQALLKGIGPPMLQKRLGIFHSRTVEEVFYCGDLCPQNGKIVIRYVGIAEADCSAIGDPLYLVAWGRQYEGCTPVFAREGRTSEKNGSLILEYGPRPSARELTLVFDDKSQCSLKKQRVPCEGITGNKNVTVQGVKSGDSLSVLTLEIQEGY